MKSESEKLRALSDKIPIDEANKIPMQDIGISTVRHFNQMDYDTDERVVIDAVKRFTVAQALRDNIAQDVTGLSFRPILPDIDFYGRYNGPAQREWMQELYGSNDYFEVYKNYKHVWPTKPGGDTRTVTLNDRHVICIFGAQDLTPKSLIKKGKPLFVNSIRFKRASVKVVTIEDISHIRETSDNHILFSTSTLWKKNDLASIDFHVTADAAYNVANIALLGLVCEPLGAEQNG